MRWRRTDSRVCSRCHLRTTRRPAASLKKRDISSKRACEKARSKRDTFSISCSTPSSPREVERPAHVGSGLAGLSVPCELSDLCVPSLWLLTQDGLVDQVSRNAADFGSRAPRVLDHPDERQVVDRIDPEPRAVDAEPVEGAGR